MKDTPTSANHTDFRARYNGTYGFFIDPDTGKRLPVQVTNATSRVVEFTDITGRALLAKVDSGLEFEFIPVDRGFVQLVDGRTIYLQRIPARQWHRGISPHNTTKHLLTSSLNPTEEPSFLEIISSLTDKSPAELFAGLVSKRLHTCALSKHFAIAADHSFYFLNKRVGEYYDGVITLFTDMVVQEVSDLIKRQNLPIQVKP